jgi:hypothetical protein
MKAQDDAGIAAKASNPVLSLSKHGWLGIHRKNAMIGR